MFGEIIHSRGRKPAASPLPISLECGPRGFSIRDFEPQEIAAIHCTGDPGLVDRAWHYLYRVGCRRSRMIRPTCLPWNYSFDYRRK